MINIKDYVKPNTAIYCESMKESEELFVLLKEAGLKWCSKDEYDEYDTYWTDIYNCYNPYDGGYADYAFYVDMKFTIYPFKQIKLGISKHFLPKNIIKKYYEYR